MRQPFLCKFHDGSAFVKKTDDIVMKFLHMLQNDRKEEFLRMTGQRNCDMINLYMKIRTI